MSYQFEGQTFPTLAALTREFPIYRSHVEIIKAGATTVAEVEKALHVKRTAGRAKSLDAARKNNSYSFSKRKTGKRA